MGGIIIKHLLTLAEERLQYKSLLENTQGIVFIGVPHRSVMSPFVHRLSNFCLSMLIYCLAGHKYTANQRMCAGGVLYRKSGTCRVN